MHEMSLAVALIDQVEQIVEKEEASVVIKLKVSIGDLSGVEEEAFKLCFPSAAEGSSAEGAYLEIEHIPLVVKCRECGRKTNPEIPFIECGACHSPNVKIVEGRDFLISSVELE